MKYSASKENITLWEDKLAKIAKLPSNPACQPLLFLSKPETLTSLMLSPRGHTTTAGFGGGGGGVREREGDDSQSPHLQIQAEKRKTILACVIFNHALNEFHIMPTIVKSILKI